MSTALAFAVFIVLGWLVFGYLAFFAAGGLQGAWQAVRGLPILVQLLVWLLLLPWMMALWIYQTGWALWLRLLLIAGLIWVTYSMAVPPLIQLLRAPK